MSAGLKLGCVYFVLSFVLVFVFGGVALAFALINHIPAISENVESLRSGILGIQPEQVNTAKAELASTKVDSPQVIVAPSSPKVIVVVVPRGEPTANANPTEARKLFKYPTPTPRAARPTPTTAPQVNVKPIQPIVQLAGFQYDYQGFNNCGPTTMHVYLTYYGKADTQKQIAASVKPDPMDKNVNPWELVAYAKSVGMNGMYRVNGTLDRLKTLLSNGIPVVVEMGFIPEKTNEGWMGHYRLVTAYDDLKFIVQDTYLGPNLPFDYATLDSNWKAFNRTYWIVYKDDQAPLVQAILGTDVDDGKMYEGAVTRARAEVAANPNDAFAQFNIGTSLNGLKRYTEAAPAFDKARALNLPWRMLWYQFGPYQAYYQVGRYDDVIALADLTLKGSDNLEESHYYKGLALEKQGHATEARKELATALKYNKNFTDAQRELASLPQP